MYACRVGVARLYTRSAMKLISGTFEYYAEIAICLSTRLNLIQNAYYTCPVYSAIAANDILFWFSCNFGKEPEGFAVEVASRQARSCGDGAVTTAIPWRRRRAGAEEGERETLRLCSFSLYFSVLLRLMVQFVPFQ